VAAETDAAHLLMAVAMAGMLSTGLAILPVRAWAGVFGLMAGWFAIRVLREARAGLMRALALGCNAPHLLHSVVMTYMLFILAGGAGAGGGPAMPAMTSGGQVLASPALAAVFALIVAGFGVRDVDQVCSGRHALAATSGAASLRLVPVVLSSGATVCCRIVMGIGMAIMLMLST
jgi:hypothetical protein